MTFHKSGRFKSLKIDERVYKGTGVSGVYIGGG